jgi:hypothetical protein
MLKIHEIANYGDDIGWVLGFWEDKILVKPPKIWKSYNDLSRSMPDFILSLPHA